MEAFAKLKKISIGSSDKLRKVRSESPNSGSWLRRLKLGKSGRKSLPNPNQINAVIHANERHMQEPYLQGDIQPYINVANRSANENSKMTHYSSCSNRNSTSRSILSTESLTARLNMGVGEPVRQSSSPVRLVSYINQKVENSKNRQREAANEARRNEQIKVRNCTLMHKEESQLTENERIIRRSVEKVDTWLRELPPSFNPIHDIMRPYLVEKRV